MCVYIYIHAHTHIYVASLENIKRGDEICIKVKSSNNKIEFTIFILYI